MITAAAHPRCAPPSLAYQVANNNDAQAYMAPYHRTQQVSMQQPLLALHTLLPIPPPPPQIKSLDKALGSTSRLPTRGSNFCTFQLADTCFPFRVAWPPLRHAYTHTSCNVPGCLHLSSLHYVLVKSLLTPSCLISTGLLAHYRQHSINNLHIKHWFS